MTAMPIEPHGLQQARALLESAGYTVRRKAAPRVDTTTRTEGTRASALIDRPTNLDKYENKAYLRGYAAGCLTYVRKTGIPRGETIEGLREATIDAEWDRHPAAHKKGMAELAAYRLRWGQM